MSSSGTKMPLAGAPGVLCRVWSAPDDGLWVRYTGLIEQILVAGIATPEMLAPRPTKRTPKIDAAGDRFQVSRYFGLQNGQPVAKVAISWRLPRERARRLPGVLAALEAGADRPDWEVAEEERRQFEERAARIDPAFRRRLAAQGRLVPHLVVDNTREARS